MERTDVRQRFIQLGIAIVVGLVIVIVLVVLVVKYKRRRAVVVAPAPTTGKPVSAVEDEVVKKFMKPMYKPQEVGHRTGRFKVFQTNKGVRTYEVNELGFPMPNAPAKQ